MPRWRNGEGTAIERESDSRVRYGGRWLATASALPLHGDVTRPRALVRLVLAAARRPLQLGALITLLLQTPREYLFLSNSPSGQALDEYFSQRSVGVLPMNRLCRGVLLLPRDHADYLRGRRRQALRTNLRRAAAAGIQCEVVSDQRRAVEDISHVVGRQWSWLTEAEFEAVLTDVRSAVKRPEITVTVARDEHGQPLATLAAIIDDTVCLITGAVATNHDARWALHDHLVRLLIAQGARHLLVDGGGTFGALGFTPNVQHYQHLLGYELRHVIPPPSDRLREGRRLIASLALAVATAVITLPRAAAGPRVGARSREASARRPPGSAE
jgi:hypothetical protein